MSEKLHLFWIHILPRMPYGKAPVQELPAEAGKSSAKAHPVRRGLGAPWELQRSWPLLKRAGTNQSRRRVQGEGCSVSSWLNEECLSSAREENQPGQEPAGRARAHDTAGPRAHLLPCRWAGEGKKGNWGHWDWPFRALKAFLPEERHSCRVFSVVNSCFPWGRFFLGYCQLQGCFSSGREVNCGVCTHTH